MSWELSRVIAELISFFIPILALIAIIVPIARQIKKSSDRRYELERYKAETERIKAESTNKEKGE